ncbi:uncharacterized protein LOC113316242 [Papaver somniferum]|uniref:uncharacterized protein LOC113316242 n=1 Tax=Papaver somniferum TaxID=3469 RepID=UPI000E7027B5|nr:uncharacterized protein LOC113316242 [Papaver somniferum]
MSDIDANSLSHPPVRASTGEIVITIPKDVIQRSKEIWKFSIVGRFDFKTLSTKFEDVKRILCDQWKLTGQVQFIPWVKGYFVIKLSNEVDRKRVSYEGPWKVKEQHLKILPWTPMFNPESEKNIRAKVWVRFPYLHFEYWEEEILFRIARGLGKPVAVDPRTLRVEYGYFVAILVDIDFSKPMPKLVIDDEDCPEGFRLDYEVLNNSAKYKDLEKLHDAEEDPVKRAALKAERDDLKDYWKK